MGVVGLESRFNELVLDVLTLVLIMEIRRSRVLMIDVKKGIWLLIANIKGL